MSVATFAEFAGSREESGAALFAAYSRYLDVFRVASVSCFEGSRGGVVSSTAGVVEGLSSGSSTADGGDKDGVSFGTRGSSSWVRGTGRGFGYGRGVGNGFRMVNWRQARVPWNANAGGVVRSLGPTVRDESSHLASGGSVSGDRDGGDGVEEVNDDGDVGGGSCSRVCDRDSALQQGANVSGVRGPNWERNHASRERKKLKKLQRREHGASLDGAGSIEHCASVVGAGLEREGFWNSCSPDVRQRLIDSKAEMHIAENKRRAVVANEAVARSESPMAFVEQAMAYVEMAEKCAKKINDSKVASWAKTVATSYAESVAKSAPNSVPSFSSCTSVDSASAVEKKRKKKKNVEEEKTFPFDACRAIGAPGKVRFIAEYRKKIGQAADVPEVEELLGEARFLLRECDYPAMQEFAEEKKKELTEFRVYA